MNRRSNLAERRIEVMNFLNQDRFLPISYPLSIMLAVGFTLLLVYNYVTTYTGFRLTFPNLLVWVALAWVFVIQGIQVVVPIIEAADLDDDLPFSWRTALVVGWILSVGADFLTGMTSLGTSTAIEADGSILFVKTLWTSGQGFLLVIFASIMITAEIWSVVSWRAVFYLHKRFWNWAFPGVFGRPAGNQTRNTSTQTQRPVNQPTNQPILRPASQINRQVNQPTNQPILRPSPKPISSQQSSFIPPEPTYHPVSFEPRENNDGQNRNDN